VAADWKLTKYDEWTITYLDDYSRFITASQVFENASTENALNVPGGASGEYGIPLLIPIKTIYITITMSVHIRH